MLFSSHKLYFDICIHEREFIHGLYTIIKYIGYLRRRRMSLQVSTQYNIAHLYLADRLNTTICHTYRCSWM